MLFFSKRWFYWFVRQYRHVTVTVMTSDNGILAQQAQKSNVVTRLGCGGGWNSRPYMLPWAAGVPYRVVCLLWIIHHISAHHREVTGYCLYQWASRSPRRRTPLKGFHSFHRSKVRWHCDRQCESYLSSYQQAYLPDEDADQHSFCELSRSNSRMDNLYHAPPSWSTVVCWPNRYGPHEVKSTRKVCWAFYKAALLCCRWWMPGIHGLGCMSVSIDGKGHWRSIGDQMVDMSNHQLQRSLNH